MGRLSALAVVALLAAPAAADGIDPADVVSVGSRDGAYLAAVRGEGLQSEIVYIRPGAAFDPATIREGRLPEPPGALDPDTARTIWGVVFALLLAGVLVFVAWFGGRIPVSFRALGEGRRRVAAETAGVPAEVPEMPADAFVQRLRGMADRRAALILLTGRALEAAAEANGLRIGRAQTARDVLRAVPRRWPHFEALRRLVREAEVVHFGGRELPEARWRECLQAALPLLGVGRSA